MHDTSTPSRPQLFSDVLCFFFLPSSRSQIMFLCFLTFCLSAWLPTFVWSRCHSIRRCLCVCLFPSLLPCLFIISVSPRPVSLCQHCRLAVSLSHPPPLSSHLVFSLFSLSGIRSTRREKNMDNDILGIYDIRTKKKLKSVRGRSE